VNQVFPPLLCGMSCFLTLLTGLVYSPAGYRHRQGVLLGQVSGSLVMRDGHPWVPRSSGSRFQDPKYFWAESRRRLPMPNNGAASTGSNLGPTNPALIDCGTRAHRRPEGRGPEELPAHSGRSRDSIRERPRSAHQPAAALYQVTRVAQARHMDVVGVRRLVLSHVEPPQLGLSGRSPRQRIVTQSGPGSRTIAADADFDRTTPRS